jgi:F0F1-type ATP synthase delta subunit
VLNKEEKITIISAVALDSVQQGLVLDALKQNKENEGKEFVIEFTEDPTIQGGLQMYTESKFMDMSLQSRLDKIRTESTTLNL